MNSVTRVCWCSSCTALCMQVIDAEMGRRKMLEDSPIASTNEDPVFFDTAQIPWWAWVKRFHLPEVRAPSALAPSPAACATTCPRHADNHVPVYKNAPLDTSLHIAPGSCGRTELL